MDPQSEKWLFTKLILFFVSMFSQWKNKMASDTSEYTPSSGDEDSDDDDCSALNDRRIVPEDELLSAIGNSEFVTIKGKIPMIHFSCLALVILPPWTVMVSLSFLEYKLSTYTFKLRIPRCCCW